MGPRKRHTLIQVAQYFVSGTSTTQAQAFCCPAVPTILTTFLCPALKLLMWSQAYGRVERGGGDGEQQEPSLPAVSKLTNHIRLKYETLTQLKGRRYFYLTTPSCLNTGLFLSLPPKCITPGTCFFLLLLAFSWGITVGQGSVHFSWLPQKVSRTWAQMVTGVGRLVLAAPLTH